MINDDSATSTVAVQSFRMACGTVVINKWQKLKCILTKFSDRANLLQDSTESDHDIEHSEGAKLLQTETVPRAMTAATTVRGKEEQKQHSSLDKPAQPPPYEPTGSRLHVNLSLTCSITAILLTIILAISTVKWPPSPQCSSEQWSPRPWTFVVPLQHVVPTHCATPWRSVH